MTSNQNDPNYLLTCGREGVRPGKVLGIITGVGGREHVLSRLRIVFKRLCRFLKMINPGWLGR